MYNVVLRHHQQHYNKLLQPRDAHESRTQNEPPQQPPTSRWQDHLLLRCGQHGQPCAPHNLVVFCIVFSIIKVFQSVISVDIAICIQQSSSVELSPNQ